MERYENVFSKPRFHQQRSIFYFLLWNLPASFFAKSPLVVGDTDYEIY